MRKLNERVNIFHLYCNLKTQEFLYFPPLWQFYFSSQKEGCVSWFLLIAKVYY